MPSCDAKIKMLPMCAHITNQASKYAVVPLKQGKIGGVFSQYPSLTCNICITNKDIDLIFRQIFTCAFLVNPTCKMYS